MESGGRGQNDDNPSLPWEIWELNNMYSSTTASVTTTGFSLVPETSCSMQQQQQEGENASTRVVFGHQSNCLYRYEEPPYQQHSLYGSNLHPDPHLMCLKLGKRHYFEDNSSGVSDRYLGGGFSLGKRGKHYDIHHMGTVASSSTAGSGGSPATLQPRCQVDGCHVALTDAKDYHKRHKVCEMHSKAPMVLVLGLEQRFCQQCSRFHVVSEFDDSKRSCRRRLAGHNERRRKSSNDSIPRNSSQDKLIGARLTHLTSPRGSALSLLSSKTDSWVSPSDLSSRSSAALRELINEHRAAVLARQLILERHLNHHHQTTMEGLSLSESSQFNNASCLTTYQGQMVIEPHCWNRFHDSSRHVTLDLMQTPSSAFGILPSRMKSKEEAEEEDEEEEEWNTFE